MPLLKGISNKQSLQSLPISLASDLKYQFQINTNLKPRIGNWLAQRSLGEAGKLEIGNWKFRIKRGFSLIELLIVIAMFGLISASITAAYASFEKNQRVKEAAITLRNDIRFTQNKALSGDKGVDKVGDCHLADILVGWYVTFQKGSDNYKIRGVCKIPSDNSEYKFPSDVNKVRTITFKDDVYISDIKYGDSHCCETANILFRPLSANVSFHFAGEEASPTTPPFLSGIALINRIGNDYPHLSPLSIDLKGPSTSYQVTISTIGEVSIKKL